MTAMPQGPLSRFASPPISEIAEILAAGLMRVLARKSSRISTTVKESSLHISPPESGHPTPTKRRMSDG